MAPPLDWLMVQLLFHDEIKTIVPATEVDRLPETHIQLYDSIRGAVTFINPENESIWASPDHENRMIRAFEQISKSTAFDSNELKIVIDKSGASTRIEHCTFLHASKTSTSILNALKDLHLMPRESSALASGFMNDRGWLIVEEDAADLLLSHLSNHLSKTYGYSPITYKSLPFALNSLNDMRAKNSPDSRTLLASAILNLEFPFELSQMSLSQYNALRDAYSDIRQPFHEFINNLSIICRLEDITSAAELQARIHAIQSDFDSRYMKFKNSKYMHQFHKWSPWVASGVLTFISCATLSTPLSLVIAGGSVLISGIDNVISESKEQPDSALMNRLSSLEKDIMKQADIKSLL
jgi:hypothetical protein